MKVRIHERFEDLLETADPAPGAFFRFSLSNPPLLGDQGLPAFRTGSSRGLD